MVRLEYIYVSLAVCKGEMKNFALGKILTFLVILILYRPLTVLPCLETFKQCRKFFKMFCKQKNKVVKKFFGGRGGLCTKIHILGVKSPSCSLFVNARVLNHMVSIANFLRGVSKVLGVVSFFR